MRLICPNCDAEYEVAAAAIPDGGRDVQCSNCGHAWFQISPEVEAEVAAEQALFDAPPKLATAESDAAAQAMPVTDAEPAAFIEPEPEPEPELPPPPVAAARSIDESVLAVLREEAEREVEARKSDTPTASPVIETQTEMGLDAPASGGLGAVARRLARMKGEPELVQRPQTRREMLPEIEEINSTLRASSEKRSGQAAIAETLGADAAQKSSFRSGFTLAFVLAVALLAAYVMAPKLAQQFPSAAGALQAYVAAIDALRLWADGALKAAIGVLKGLTGGKA